MSEDRPLDREDFRRLMSHSPTVECVQLCDEFLGLEEQLFQTEDHGEKQRLALLIKAVKTRMQSLHCPDC